jgi:hypothetical protein
MKKNMVVGYSDFGSPLKDFAMIVLRMSGVCR